jgi:hypothetical protein
MGRQLPLGRVQFMAMTKQIQLELAAEAQCILDKIIDGDLPAHDNLLFRTRLMKEADLVQGLGIHSQDLAFSMILQVETPVINENL